jgi:hypothetical protein
MQDVFGDYRVRCRVLHLRANGERAAGVML